MKQVDAAMYEAKRRGKRISLPFLAGIEPFRPQKIGGIRECSDKMVNVVDTLLRQCTAQLFPRQAIPLTILNLLRRNKEFRIERVALANSQCLILDSGPLRKSLCQIQIQHCTSMLHIATVPRGSSNAR
jgi:hypothetical protein